MASRPAEFFDMFNVTTSVVTKAFGFPAGFLTVRNDAARSVWMQLSSQATVSSSQNTGYELKSSEIYGPLLWVPGPTFISLYSTAASSVRLHAMGPIVSTS